MDARKRRLIGPILFSVAVIALVWHYKAPTEADAVMAASKLAAVGPGIAGAAGPTTGNGPHIAGCPIFPADNVWNTPIDSLKKDKRSDDYIHLFQYRCFDLIHSTSKLGQLCSVLHN